MYTLSYKTVGIRWATVAIRIIPISEVRQNLKRILADIEATGEACFITQYGRPKAALVRYADYKAMTGARTNGHPYIGRDPGISGGEPLIRGTRITVRHIVQLTRSGFAVDQILAAHPHLTAAQVHDALSYSYDHQNEIDRLIEETRLERVIADQGLDVEEIEPGIWELRREPPR